MSHRNRLWKYAPFQKNVFSYIAKHRNLDVYNKVPKLGINQEMFQLYHPHDLKKDLK